MAPGEERLALRRPSIAPASHSNVQIGMDHALNGRGHQHADACRF